jgi:type IX secretion system PorP/SprF family membrane protein
MKKIILIVLVICCSVALNAQQTDQFTQFTLNDYGMNPAVAGSANGLMFLFGQRVQWRGFDLAPQSQFANITYALGKKGYRHYWHGVGAYVEQDRMGVFTNKVAYLSYAIHLKVSPTYRMGFGIAAGVKNMALSNIVFDYNDPALANSAKSVMVPDIIPGIYLYSKKFSLSVSARDLYDNKMSFGKKTLASGTKLLPTAYISITRKFVSGGYGLITIPAINIQSNFRGIPSVNFNVITYYKKRVGVGFNYRMHDAVSGILQVRVYKNLIVGFAYDLTISRFRVGKANSDEIMVGFSPLMSTEDLEKLGTTNCPKFEM